MKIIAAFMEFVSRINLFSIPPVVGGHKVEINRRVHLIMYGSERE